MWIVFSLLTICLSYAGGHVSLIYPPARNYGWDFMDNLRTPGPCGVPAGVEPTTSLLAGSTINVNFHLAYPHRGGFFLEVMNNETNAVSRYPATGYIDTDTLKRSASITLPAEACQNCWIRLVRQAAEWSAGCKPYLFWSCANVDIVTGQFTEGCSNHGTWSNSQCQCDNKHVGDRCQHKVDCKTNADCNNHGECKDIAITPNPIKHCYCQHGWFGLNCEKVSPVTSLNVALDQYKQATMSPDYLLYYRFLPTSDEIEMVLKVKSTNWVAIGWRPSYLKSGCQLFPNLPGRPQWQVGTKPAPSTSAPETNAEGNSEPETHAEGTSEPETHAEGTSEPETHAEGTSEPETHAEGTSEPETHAEGTSEPETHAEGTSEPETHAESTSEPESHAEGTSEPETHAESTSEPETHAEGTSEPETHAEGTSEPETHAEGTSEPETHAEGTSEPETGAEAEATSEPETEGEPEAEGGSSTGCNAAPGYSAGGQFSGTSDTAGGNPHAMDCTDIIIGTAQGNLSRVGDYYTRDRSTPKHDTIYGGEDSLTAAIGYQQNGETVILFRRKVTATHRSDFTIESETMHVIWAHGQVNDAYIHAPASGDKPGFYSEDQLLYHGHRPNRGVQNINFLENAQDTSTVCNGYWPASCPPEGCNYKVTWVYDAATDLITFNLKAKLNGAAKWIGIGFSDTASMANTDAYIGWVEGGQVTVTDRWAAGYSMPTLDGSDNIYNKTGSVINGETSITFTRPRDTGDSANDFTFTDTDCPFMIYAVGGGYTNGTQNINKHAETPTISSQRVCIRACDAVVPTDVALKTSVEVKLTETFDEKLLNQGSNEYKELKTKMETWFDTTLSAVPGYKSTEVTGFRKGSIIVMADIIVNTADDTSATKSALKTSTTQALQNGFSSPPKDYTFDDTFIEVSDPRKVTDEEDAGFMLTLTEEIVIGLAVALVVVVIVVAVCKCSEIQKAKAKTAHKRLNGKGGDSPASSSTSLSNGKGSRQSTQNSTISYDEFMQKKQIP